MPVAGHASRGSALSVTIGELRSVLLRDVASSSGAAGLGAVRSSAREPESGTGSSPHPAAPSKALLAQYAKSGITCSGVAVFPHSPADVNTLRWIAGKTDGRFYNVKNPQSLPQIFIKEAQVVRRALIVEITPEGLEMLTVIRPIVDEAIREYWGQHLTKAEASAMLDVADRIIKANANWFD